MNDSTPPPPEENDAGTTRTDAPGDGFDSRHLRSITDARRSCDDRLLGGVCTGLARHLDIDPVVVRIVFGALTFVGGAGIIVYVAAWFLLPSDNGPSVAADWFKLDDNEEKVRVGGLVVAGVVAVLAVVGDSGWGWGFTAPWVLLPLALLTYFFVMRPRQRAIATTAPEHRPDSPDGPPTSLLDDWQAERRARRTRRSRALTGLTVSVGLIGIAVTRLVADARGGTPWTTYVAVSLAIVGLGLLVSAFAGDGGPLIVIGVLLAIVLATGTLLPSPRIGQQAMAPTTSAELASRYEHGIGEVRLDLTEVLDPTALLGRTVEIDTGVGHTTVVVPNGLNVSVDTSLDLGQIDVFDRTVSGNENRLDAPADPGRALTLSIDQKVGNIEVIRK